MSLYTCTHTLKWLPRELRDLGIIRTPRLFGAMVGRKISVGGRISLQEASSIPSWSIESWVGCIYSDCPAHCMETQMNLLANSILGKVELG